jgi:predicted nucleotidyltransferase
MSDFHALLSRLVMQKVEFILVGGVAAVVHGSARLTEDIDIAYRRSPENLSRLVRALSGTAPYLRGAPPGLPFQWDERTLAAGLNFTLTTSVGAIDLFGEIIGGGGYEQLLPFTARIHVYGLEICCLNLEKLIEVKKATGRPKDFEVISELEALRRRNG